MNNELVKITMNNETNLNLKNKRMEMKIRDMKKHQVDSA